MHLGQKAVVWFNEVTKRVPDTPCVASVLTRRDTERTYSTLKIILFLGKLVETS